MPKILITGNGFDLNFNLPTSYSDFINVLHNLETVKEYNFENIYTVCKKYDKIKNSFTNDIIFDKEKVSELINLLNSNLWFQFFKSEFNIETWIDFEIKIEYVLKNIFNFLEYFESYYFNSGATPIDNLRIGSNHYNNNIVYLNILKSFQLIRQDSVGLVISKNLFIEKYNKHINVNYEAISQLLNYQLNEFKKIFNLYFELFVMPLYDKIQNRVDSDLFTSINYHFTFNYTPTFENLFGNIKTNFLHGKINSKENKIVLGIDEIPTDKNNNYYKFYIPFTKYYQKLNNNTDYYFLNELTSHDSNSNYIFYFIGHSLDESDKDYINEVFDFVNKSKSEIKKIIIAYHNESSKSTLLINLLNIRGKDDITKLMREKVLLFEQLNTEEFVKKLNLDINRHTYLGSFGL